MKIIIPFISVTCILLLFTACQPGENVNNTQNLRQWVIKPFIINGDSMENKNVSIDARSLSNSNVIVYQNYIVIFGGLYKSENGFLKDKNDCLVSDDGKQWKIIDDKLINPEINQYTIGIYNDMLIVNGGIESRDDLTLPEQYCSNVILFDTTKSTVSVIKNLPALATASIIEFRGNLFIIGGYDKSQPQNKVFKISSNKVVSQTTIPDVEGIGLGATQAWVSNNTLFVTDIEGTFWKSSDGLNWEKVKIETPFIPRGGYVVIPRGDDWYLAGGTAGNPAGLREDDVGLCNDVWKSSDDGKNWELLSIGLDNQNKGSHGAGKFGYYKSFPARQDCVGLVFKDKLLIGGGRDDSGYRHDFWASEDGITWKELK